MIVYKTTNLTNGMIYVGQDSKNNPSYYGSGILLNLAIKKYGIENFKKEILEYCSSYEELSLKEIYWIAALNTTNRNIGYNLTQGGDGGNTWDLNRNKQITIEKLRKSSSGRRHSEETKKLISSLRKGKGNGCYGKTPWNKGNPTSEETKEKIRQKNKGLGFGRKLSDITKDKISKLHKDKPKTQEHKNKISKTLTGRKIDRDIVEKTASKLRGKKHNQVQCPYCDKIGGYPAMQRWHYDNCRSRYKTDDNN